MKKKIKVSEARLGMYIESLCGSWVNHPFWKKSFLLDKQQDLEELLACGTEEMWIDTGIGEDVANAPKPQDEDGESGNIEKTPPPSPVLLSEELQRARKIRARGRVAIKEMFKQAFNKELFHLDHVLILVDEIRKSIARNQSAFLSLMREKEEKEYLSLHSISMCALMVILGRKMGMDNETVLSLGLAGLLQDIGSVDIPPELLNKQGELTPAEFEIVKVHPKRGWEILNAHNLDNIVMDVCLHHHERIDGKGYPNKLPVDMLTVFSRMAAVCDTYDSLISDSSYRKGVSPASAIRSMAKWQDTQFDRSVFHAFVSAVGIYPCGTLLRLRSERLAVVEEQSPVSLSTPIVRVFFSIKRDQPIFQEWVDLSKGHDSIVSVEEAASVEKQFRINLKTMSVL